MSAELFLAERAGDTMLFGRAASVWQPWM